MHGKPGAGSENVGRGFHPHEERDEDAAVATIAQSFQRVSQDAGQEKGGKNPKEHFMFAALGLGTRTGESRCSREVELLCRAKPFQLIHMFPNDKSHSFM